MTTPEREQFIILDDPPGENMSPEVRANILAWYAEQLARQDVDIIVVSRDALHL